MSEEAHPVYTLHYFPFSLYSLMARFGFVLGQALNRESAPKLEVRLIDLHRDEHLSEPYLTQVTCKGQVPALTSAALDSMLDDSRDIAKWLCERQPELLPEEHRETIERLMDKLYAFHCKALLVAPEDRNHGFPNQAAAMLESTDLSEKHRRALEMKSIFRTLEPDSILRAEEQAQDFMRDLSEVLGEYGGEDRTWIFGDKPTILDAHATALAARLIDAKRLDVLSEAVQLYTRRVLETEEWKAVTHGRPTLWDTSIGHAADLDPL
ncbi:Thioredoxin-like protein [Hirsutella rhossiliensis]|uniref:Thioredoxin-like protein n=1 Tax=Hirsutella rhossiliensis TaxID=111463 RepID=A0A9P8SKP4_9HYPO|nr:Thioredoxin-like protein [Hirsutella rhossiliensis]KAH0964341.1 Thioredoxin-like protein [Hirsutella rhossiliensis]